MSLVAVLGQNKGHTNRAWIWLNELLLLILSPDTTGKGP